ncbi:ABC transporter substrate-binding protein [Desertivibrio insolitus]|uniref:ABC transporter substrate-binding protein n=1 Tax=Herbiconiux sp. SYSU D00978 TaxID=2812562 RepID=UPI001A97A241|nr:ABC transporter substrate-binding protein [Herbiconiux sp. SYSU D00978]
MTTTLLTRATAVVAVALVLTGCSGTDGGTTLEFQTGLGANDPILDELTRITDEFESDSDVTIDLVPMTNSYEADLTVRLSSNDVPDIFATHGWSLSRYRDFLEPLTDQPWAAELNPALEPVMVDDEGDLYAFPAVTDVAGIVYNQTVLQDLGIDPATLTTWERFDAALETVAASGITPLAASGRDDWFAGNLTDFMASGAFDEGGLADLESGTFVPDGFATVLEKISEWSDAGYFNPDYSSASQDDLARAIGQGDAAFVFVQNYLVASALSFDPEARLGFLPIPAFEGEPYLVGGEGHAYGVSATSEHKDVALDFVAFLAEPENASALASAIGGAPGLTTADTDLGVLEESYERFVEPGEVPLLPYFDRVHLPDGMWDTLVSATDAVIVQQSGVDDAVDQIESQFATLSAG